MNTGELSGEIPLIANSATYIDKEFDCTISFAFASGSLGLTQNGSCGVGLNVSAGGTYKRVSSSAPKFPEQTTHSAFVPPNPLTENFA